MRDHVLIVEDNSDDSSLMSEIVGGMMSLDHTLVRDGNLAIRIAQEHAYNYNLVLLDLQLPTLQGWEIARALRKMDRFQTVPIIAITAYDGTRARIRCEAAGCDAYLTKPVDIDVLISVIRKYLKLHHKPA